MKAFLNRLETVISREKKLKKFLEGHLAKHPGKTLCTSINKGHLRYFCSEKGKYTYLRKDQTELIRDLEFKNYCTVMCRTIDKNIKALKKIEKLLKSYKNPEAVFEEIPKNKRHLIKGYQYKSRKVKMLMEEYGPGSDYDRIAMLNDPFGSRTRPTKSGYYVRSKAEEAIADEAFERGLFFLYEKDLTLETERGPVTILPDFTFFNIYTEGFVFLEHFGKVDSVEYAGKNLPRIADYMANGYELEKDLFITMEGENHRFTRKEIKKVLDKIEEQLQ